MKVHLMYRDRDFNPQQELPSNERDLMQDLELNTLLNAMALGDRFLYEIAKTTLLTSLKEPDAIQYRQDILKDCLRNPSVIRDIYQLPIESMENKRRHWMGIFSRYPSGILSSAIEMMYMFVGLLKKLRNIADQHADSFESEGFRAFFSMIKRELDDEYLATIQEHLRELRFQDGILISAELGQANGGTHYVLRKPSSRRSWMKRLLTPDAPTYSFDIHPRDDHGARALAELSNRGINLVANALAQSADHIDNFFQTLRAELAFYIGCLNLYEQLAQLGEPVTFPIPAPLEERQLAFVGLYDPCLALTVRQRVVGNDVSADGRDLVIITGANQGGKSTFLRSIGLAQLMMQCGLFVPAESFRANVCSGLFTHYKREEDATMKSGKFDEELSRMSAIADNLSPHAMVLFNESFAATNEREGSEIARQIVTALLEGRIKVFFVTHLYEFAHRLYTRATENMLFLRAERMPDGRRTFRLKEGQPLQTSYGKDLYYTIFRAPTS